MWQEFIDDYHQLIQLNQTFSELNDTFLNEQKMNEKPQMVLSRVDIIIENSEGKGYIYVFIDRNLTIFRYNLLQQTDKNLEKDKEFYLNKSIVNDTCFDMAVRENFQYSVVLFCQSQYYDSDQHPHTSYHLVLIENIFGELDIKYLTYLDQISVTQHEEKGIKYIGDEIREFTGDVGLFLGISLSQFRILRIDFEKIRQMFKNQTNQNQLFVNQSDIINTKYSVDFGTELNQKEIQDFLSLKHRQKLLAVLFDNQIRICQYEWSVLSPPDPLNPTQNLDCYNNAQFFQQENAVALYQSDFEEMYLYVAVSIPPQILELNLSDRINIIIQKIYTTLEVVSNHIGLNIMAVNSNFLVHLMEDINTRRNEQKIKLVSIESWSLKFYGTNSTLIEKYKNNWIACSIGIKNLDSDHHVEFNLTFIDKYYTQVKSRDMDYYPFDMNDIQVFYNCGDESFKYSTTSYFIGPNFELELQDQRQNCEDGDCYFKIKNQEFILDFESTFDFTECMFFQLYPPYQGGLLHQDGFILLCIDIYGVKIKSYTQNKGNNSFDLTNEIKLGETQEYIFHSFKGHASQNVIITQHVDQSISIFEILSEIQDFEIKWLKTYTFDGIDQLHGIDFEQEKFIILYADDNTILVYQLTHDLKLQYMRKMPMYKNYQNYQFHKNKIQPKLYAKTYYDGFLAIIMENKDNTTDPERKVFVYCIFCQSQHDSFVLVQDFQEFFDLKTYTQIQLLKNSTKFMFVAAHMTKIEIFYAEFYNNIQVQQSSEIFDLLVKNCSNININETDATRISFLESAKQIAKLKIRAKTLFQDRTPSSGSIQVKIYTQNQGMVIKPIMGNEVEIVYSNSLSSELLIQDYFQGMSISVDYNCQYLNDGEVESCNNIVTDNSLSQKFRFYLEFVTSARKVVFSQTLGNFFFMIDNLQFSYLLRLQDGSRDFEAMNLRSLEQLRRVWTLDDFGCELDGYLDISLYKKINTTSIYIVIYQCSIGGLSHLSQAKILIHDHPIKDSYMEVIQFFGNYRFPYKIIDADKGSFQQVDLFTDSNIIEVRVAMTIEIPESFSNLLQSITIVMNLTGNFALTLDPKSISSLTEDKDTFLVTKSIQVPGSDIVIIVDKLTGAYLYDLKNAQNIYWLDLKNLDEFFEQSEADAGQSLLVTGIVAQWPSTIHLVSNFGIYIITFNVDLTNRTQFLREGQIYAINILKKQIIRQSFQQYSLNIAQNQYAYAFLTKQNITSEIYDVDLVVISLYSAESSQVMGIFKIGTNFVCNSLSQSSSLEISSIDEIGVSFICDTQLYVFRVSTRRHLVLDFHKIDSLESSSSLIKKKSSYLTTYNLTLVGKTALSDHQETVKIIFKQTGNPNQQSSQILIASICFILLISLVIFSLIKFSNLDAKKRLSLNSTNSLMKSHYQEITLNKLKNRSKQNKKKNRDRRSYQASIVQYNIETLFTEYIQSPLSLRGTDTKDINFEQSQIQKTNEQSNKQLDTIMDISSEQLELQMRNSTYYSINKSLLEDQVSENNEAKVNTLYDQIDYQKKGKMSFWQRKLNDKLQ
ncbi:UNKNOWN [Stylonychia lemnae]|uniref:Transmembrane protein n=1 Tax=Stylonychia lemnae TaxID=5949 RepID=A0A078A631_STYLE|nr:UNKNOWN [Stylonychia lemnae]|eukprot:CDW77654.1 UNKNOWN [Stylonychia lemnae]